MKTTLSLAAALAEWFGRHSRSLPWRDDPTPWRVWVSEIMLQQTRVEAMREAFLRFVARFPDAAALAKAPEDEVLRFWSGLGYYRRARLLRRAACEVTERFGGRIPNDREAFLSLPGVGRYTAGAVLSIAFGRPEPVLDGNVERVLCRLEAIEQPLKSAEVQRHLWRRAEALVAEGAAEKIPPGVVNQSLMELGALVCTPRAPSCGSCPLLECCKAGLAGPAERYPVRSPRPELTDLRYFMLAAFEAGGRLLLVRGKGESLLPDDLWELPHVEWPQGQARRPLAALQRALGASFAIDGEPVEARHAITRWRIAAAAATASLGNLDPTQWKETEPGHWRRADEIPGRWREARCFELTEVADLPRASLTSKLVKAVSHERQAANPRIAKPARARARARCRR